MLRISRYLALIGAVTLPLPTSLDANRPAKLLGPCETYITITQAPASPYEATTASITVEYGEIMDVIPPCLSSGGPDVSTFRFTVNGIDRTSYFTTGASQATATAVPLLVGTDDTLRATIEGYDLQGNPRTEEDIRIITVPFYGAEVTPLGPPSQLATGSTATLNFVVDNTSSLSVAYTFACTATGSMQCDGVVTPPSATLPALTKDTISVGTIAAQTGGNGTIRLSASSSKANAAATVSILVVAPVRLSLAYTRGDRLLRGACPIVGAGPESAMQCGDLLYAHTLPGHRSMSESRTLTLLYSSAMARPTPVVVADYATYANAPLTQALKMVAHRTSDGLKLADTTFFSNAGFSTSMTQLHRLVAPVNGDSLGLATGAFPITVSVSRKENGTWLPFDVATGRLLVVNRRKSPFGAGWWPAGVERLYLNQDAQSSAFLVFADGSALFFQGNGSGAFTAPAGEHSTLSTIGGVYKRVLPGERETIWYSSAGLVDSVTDNNPSRNKATYAWAAGGPDGVTIASITDAVAKSVTFTRDGGNRVTQILIPGLNAVALVQSTPDGAGVTKLNQITDPDAYAIIFGYDAASLRMTTSASRRTGTVTYTHHPVLGTLESATAPGGVGSTKNFRAWQASGAPVAASGAGSGRTEATAVTPATPDTVRTIASWARAAVRDTVWFRVDPFGSPIEILKPVGNFTAITRDSVSQPTRILTVRGADGTQVWDANGNLTHSIRKVKNGWGDPNTVRYDTTRYAYHATWRTVTTITPADGTGIQSFGYDAYGRRTSATDALGRVTQFFFSARGMLDSIAEPHPTVAGNREAFATRYTYDPLTLNMLSVTDSTGGVSYAYDAVNQSDLVTVTDALTNRTEYTYDGIKRPLVVRRVAVAGSGVYAGNRAEPPASVVRHAYNDAARVDTLIDPLGRASTWTYDVAGRLITRCVRVSWCESTSYTDGLNPTILTLRSGKHITQAFDGAGRVAFKQIGDGTPFFPYGDDTIRYIYDQDGNLTSAINRFAKITRDHDPYGQMKLEREDIRYWRDSTKFHGVEVRHDFDRQGRRIRSYLGNPTWVRVCTPFPDDFTCTQPFALSAKDTIRFHYDLVGNLDTLDNSLFQPTKGTGRRKWSYTYDRKNRLTDLDVPTTTVGTNNPHWVYDNDDRLMVQSGGSLSRPTETLIRDVTGRVTQNTTWRTERATYDGLGRLIYWAIDGTFPTDSFVYDIGGNRLRDKRWNYVYNDRNQLTSRADGSCTMLYSFDSHGNQLASSWQGSPCSEASLDSSAYDAGDRMTTRNSKSPHVEPRVMWYDGLGRRVAMKSDSAGLGIDPGDEGLWRFRWLDDNQVVKTYNGPNDPALQDAFWPTISRTAGNALTGTGEWFFNGPGTDNILASWNCKCSTTGQRRLFFKDSRGSVNHITDEAGVGQNQAAPSFGPWGTPENAPGAAKTNPGYNGHESAGGLVYMRNRWYDPNTGRFTQEDPIGFDGGSNLYGYVGADPINFSDPLGLCPKDKGGDGKSKVLSDCPPDSEGAEEFLNPPGLKNVTVETAAVVTGVVGVARGGISVAAGSGAVKEGAERLVIRAQVAMMNSQRGSYTAGFTAGFSKSLFLKGTSGLPKPVLPTPAMATGYKHGETAGLFAKALLRLVGGG